MFIGTIPKDTRNVLIRCDLLIAIHGNILHFFDISNFHSRRLQGTLDLDINLFDKSNASFPEGRQIVGWSLCDSDALECNVGLLRGPRSQSVEYVGMNISYSGYVFV